MKNESKVGVRGSDLRGRVAGLALVLAGPALVACGGAGDAPPSSPGGSSPAVAAAAPAATPSSDAPPPAAASAPPAASAPAPVAASAPPPPPASKCPPGMAEVGGGKFKSSYYRAEMSVEPFCIDKNITTATEYTACVDSGKCDKSAVHACDPSTFNVADRGNMPMICVDFGQAERYCKAQGKRLISDLEWEWAARNGEEARPFPWGTEAPAEQLCWSGKAKRNTPCPIGSYAPGPHGINDLVGNVYQWTTTTNDTTGTFRGGRGGSWKDASPELVKTTHRFGFKNTYRCGFLGIRCSTAVP